MGSSPAGGQRQLTTVRRERLSCGASSGRGCQGSLARSLSPLNRSAFPLADLMSLKRMMEKLGVPKTHLEMKKMISEVTGGVSDTISYRDFVNMMLGKRSAVLKL